MVVFHLGFCLLGLYETNLKFREVNIRRKEKVEKNSFGAFL